MTEPSQGILTTVYVVKILEKPSLAHMRAKQPVPMAIEFATIEQMQELIRQLQARIDQGDSAVRVHLLVDLAHV